MLSLKLKEDSIVQLWTQFKGSKGAPVVVFPNSCSEQQVASALGSDGKKVKKTMKVCLWKWRRTGSADIQFSHCNSTD